MNTGQLLLMIAAMMLLSFITISVNSTILSSSDSMLESEATLNALSVAQSMLDEIARKEFDEKTITKRVFYADSLTSASVLGPELGEVYPNFDDIDDYNYFQEPHAKQVVTPRMGAFFVVDSIYYIPDPTTTGYNFDYPQPYGTRTFYKKIVVEVSHPSMPHPLRLEDLWVYRRYF
ncbi:MAG: hypothetical protein V3U68_04210 [Bacteroidota bacterium]